MKYSEPQLVRFSARCGSVCLRNQVAMAHSAQSSSAMFFGDLVHVGTCNYIEFKAAWSPGRYYSFARRRVRQLIESQQVDLGAQARKLCRQNPDLQLLLPWHTLSRNFQPLNPRRLPHVNTCSIVRRIRV